MLLILLTLCLRKPNGISHLFSIAYAFSGNGFHALPSGSRRDPRADRFSPCGIKLALHGQCVFRTTERRSNTMDGGAVACRERAAPPTRRATRDIWVAHARASSPWQVVSSAWFPLVFTPLRTPPQRPSPSLRAREGTLSRGGCALPDSVCACATVHIGHGL